MLSLVAAANMMPTDCKTLAPIWETLATDFANDDNVLIAKVDAEGENSKATAKEQGVSSYPTIKWFPAGSTEAIPYTGARGEKDFISWVNEKAGTHRVAGGGLDATAGTIAMLDAIVAKFTGGSTLVEVAAEVKKAAGELAGGAQYKYAEYYVRVFEKLSASDNYVAKELARLDGILTKGGLAPSKRDEIKTKTNVLRKIAETVADKIKEASEAAKEEL